MLPMFTGFKNTLIEYIVIQQLGGATMRIKMKLVTKLFIFCFISISIIVGIIGYGALTYVKQNAVTQFADSMQRSVEMSRDSIDLNLVSIRTMAIQIAQNPDIKRLIATENHDACGDLLVCDLKFGTPINKLLSGYAAQNQYINTLFIVGKSTNDNQFKPINAPSSINYDGIKFMHRSLDSDLSGFTFTNTNLHWLSQIATSNHVIWIPSKISSFSFGLENELLFYDRNHRIMNSGYKSPTFTVGYPIHSEDTLSFVIAEISTNLFRDTMGTDSSTKQNLVINNNNEIIYDEDAEQLSLPTVINPVIKPGQKSGYLLQSAPEGDLLISFARSAVNDWTIFHITPISSIPLYPTTLIIMFIVGLIVFVAIVSILISIFAQRVISRPLIQLSSAIASVEHGATSIERVNINSSDEIGTLGRTMNFVANLLDQVKEQSELAKANRNEVKYLLDNTGHGILSFGSDLKIHEEYSSEIEYIYRRTSFIGRDFVEITFPHEITFLHQIFNEVFSLVDPNQQNTYLSLLPNEVNIVYQTYQLEYKMITKYNNSACMVIFTDITEKRALESKLDQESKSMKMIIKAVQSRNDVLQTISTYKKFAMVEIAIRLDEANDEFDAYEHLMRQVHTFKGTFAQFHFVHIGSFLHALEDKLSQFEDSDVTHKNLAHHLPSLELIQAIADDEKILRDALGDDFFEQESTSTITNAKLEQLKQHMIRFVKPEYMEQMILMFDEVRQKPFRALLETYPSFVSELAIGLEKYIHPLEIKGGNRLVDEQHYSPFAHSLVHVFRNILDHGIETIDERANSGKNEYGIVTCEFIDNPHALELHIGDDGRGIDRERVMKKAIQKGLCTPSQAEEMTTEQVIEYIFADDFSTKDEVNQLSGRGIGMAAVKEEIEKIGGTLRVQSDVGKGTTFIFWIPTG